MDDRGRPPTAKARGRGRPWPHMALAAHAWSGRQWPTVAVRGRGRPLPPHTMAARGRPCGHPWPRLAVAAKCHRALNQLGMVVAEGARRDIKIKIKFEIDIRIK